MSASTGENVTRVSFPFRSRQSHNSQRPWRNSVWTADDKCKIELFSAARHTVGFVVCSGGSRKHEQADANKAAFVLSANHTQLCFSTQSPRPISPRRCEHTALSCRKIENSDFASILKRNVFVLCDNIFYPLPPLSLPLSLSSLQCNEACS